MLTGSSDQQSETAKAVMDVCNESRNLRIHTAEALDNARSEIIEEIRQMRKKNETNDFFLTAVKMIGFGEAGMRAPKEQTILRSLHFSTIKVRFEEIKSAHARTFEWAYIDTKIHLKPWLETEGGIFWVTGKAGSGKSTFMKFLCCRKETQTALEQWAGPKRTITLSYFFWNSGYPEQKTQEGLLRSLLFQVFRQAPELMSIICPGRWNDISERESVWTLRELSEVFQLLGKQKSLPVRLCFFVDGLDEFEPSFKNGDHKNLLQILKDVSTSPDIKLCLSSRPWPFVLNELSRSNRKLYMQDLTNNDMRIYVQEVLESDEYFRKLQRRTPECTKLISQITAKAQGVFLWVYLVVRSIFKGLEDQDTTAELQRRIDALPEGLEELFKQSIESIEPVYQAQSARILQTALVADPPLSIVAYHFLDVEIQNSEYAMDENIDLHKGDVDFYERMRRRLHARSKDLLEVREWSHEDKNSCHNVMVQFIHRTVKEFLGGSRDASAMLRERTPGFDPRTSICRSLLAEIKTYPTEEPPFEKVDYLLCYTREVEFHNRVAQTDVLDELDRHFTRKHTVSGHWTNLRSNTTPFPPHIEDRCDFLGLAIQTKQRLYVEQKISKNRHLLDPDRKVGRPYLDYALRPIVEKSFGIILLPDFSDPGMVRMLLELGENPNLPSPPISRGLTGMTPWVMFLIYCDQMCDTIPDRELPFIVRNFPDVVELLLKHGANPTQKFERITFRRRKERVQLSAKEVLAKMLSEDDLRRLLPAAEDSETEPGTDDPEPQPATKDPESQPHRKGRALVMSKLRKLLCCA